MSTETTTPMNTEKPDYGEPWTYEALEWGKIATRDGKPIVYYADNMEERYRSRAIACVAACAGMSDPVAEIAAMHEAMQAAYEAIYSSRDLSGDWEDRRLAAAMTKLQPFVKP